MFRSLVVVLLVLVNSAFTGQARAQCAAANPNANVPVMTPTSDFIDHGDGTVTHQLTGLMWKRCAEGRTWDGGTSSCVGTLADLNWRSALQTAASDRTAGYFDWRLPNTHELFSIAETCGRHPAINGSVFPNTPSLSFWSGSTHTLEPGRAWSVHFAVGYAYPQDKSLLYHARLVRAGRPYDAFDARPLEGDLNTDGQVDSLDVGVLMSRWGSADAQADLSGNGMVDTADLEILLNKL